ncbi:MAG: hypothetical protein ACRDN0_36875 [Trebonia sp.]
MLAGKSRPARSDGGLPGSSLIEGGFGNRPRASQPRRVSQSRRAGHSRRRKTARAAAPLLVPLALALTLGVILAVSSSGSQTTHVNQTTSTTVRP